MTLDEYQNRAMSTAVYPGGGTTLGLTYAVTALVGEAGELAGKYSKVVRDDGGLLTPGRKAALILEAGDLLWYLTCLARELGTGLEGIAELNLTKLAARQAAGTLNGDGDYR